MLRPFTGWERTVNPARAGMIPVRWAHKRALKSKPRASGDDPRTHSLQVTPVP